MKHPDFDSFSARAKSLEDAFFSERDAALLAALKNQLNASEVRDLLASATGVQDDLALPEMAGLPVPQFLAVLGLFPMVAVAWCDHQVASAERAIILKLAQEMGVQPDSTSYQLLNRWLETKPQDDAAMLWTDYVQSVCATLQPATVAKLKAAVISRARQVANAEGGMFGFGRSVSATEEACLAQLERAFS